MRHLGIDYGTRRVGLAVSDEGGRFATPLEVLEVGSLQQALEGVAAAVAEEGAEILSAKLHVGTHQMRLDALSYRINGLKLEPVKNEHWTVDLDQRLEQIANVFELLDGKYVNLKHRLNETGAPRPQASPEDVAEMPPPVDAPPSAGAVTEPF